MGHIFISYSSPDYRDAADLCNYLEARGKKCWMAPRDVPTGAPHSNVIPDAIVASAGLVAIVSEATNSSAYVKREIEFAIGERKHLVPVLARDITPDGELRYLLNRYQWVNAYKQPIDKWRAEVLDGLNNGGKTPVAQTARVQTDIALSPVFLIAAFSAFVLAVAAGVASSAQGGFDASCRLDQLQACLSDKYTAIFLALTLLAASILVPSVATGRYRHRTVEWRDFLAYSFGGVLVVLGVLIPIWSVSIVTLLALIVYATAFRPWFNASRMAMAAGGLMLAIPAAVYSEAAILQTWHGQSSNALVIFEPESAKLNLRPEKLEFEVFGLLRNSLRITAQGALKVAPYNEPDIKDFMRRFRFASRVELSHLFQAALFENGPFRVVFRTDIVPKERCGRLWGTFTVEASEYVLGQPPFWYNGEAKSFPGWANFNQVVELDEKKGLKNPDLLQALVAAHVVYVLGLQKQHKEIGEVRVPDAELALAQRKVLERLIKLADVQCQGGTASSPGRAPAELAGQACMALQQNNPNNIFLALGELKKVQSNALSDSNGSRLVNAPSCSQDIERRLDLAARSPAGAAAP